MSINKDLLEILACPQCKGDLILAENKEGLICTQCNLLFPIQGGIPVMLIDEATPFK